MDMKDRIAVFCSARYDIDQEYNEAARLFVRGAAVRGFKVVSGGTVKGTMGVISDELEKCGGYHIGVVPRFMSQYAYPGLSELIWTDSLAERKDVLRKGTCAVVALPGGIGTLDEVIDTFSLLYLGKYDGKVCLLNYKGFYEPLLALMRHYVDQKMMSGETLDRLVVADTPEELLLKIQ